MGKEDKDADTNEYSPEKKSFADLEEAIRKRPEMYVGNDVFRIGKYLMTEIIDFYSEGKITFEITICGDNDFILGVTVEQESNDFWEKLFSGSLDLYYHIALKVIASKLEVNTISPAKTEMHISFNKEIFPHTTVDYIRLSEKILQFALLNRRCGIITIDKREAFINQNYYHFPQGVFYLFDRATKEVLGKPEFKMTFDGTINNNAYQIGLAYRTDWYPAPDIVSFANNIATYPSTLIDGVLEGFISACRKYVKANNLQTHKIKRSKFMNGLIIVCAVRGENLIHGGSFKERLEDDAIKKDAKKLMAQLALDFFNSHKEQTEKFLFRFDTGQFTSCMY